MEDNKNDEVQMVPLFQAENTIMHLGFANRRMLIALLAVCITFIITIIVFTVAHTIREKNWIDALTSMTNRPAVVEVADNAPVP